MNLYLDNGYANMGGIIDIPVPFIFCIGGRGTGKTYGALKEIVSRETTFFLMRRLQSHIDIISKPEYSPFKKLNMDLHWNISVETIAKNQAAFYRDEGESPIGYAGALSTISKIRGFDSSDVDIILYDEFVPERHEHTIKNEGAAFLNAYETINRNRELSGGKPVKCLCLGNAENIMNALFVELGLVRKAEQMLRKGQTTSIDSKRGVAIVFLKDSPISKKKKDSALYRLTSGNEFEQMALNNDFVEREYNNVKSLKISELRPIVTVGELTLYNHKVSGMLYASTHSSGSVPVYGTSEQEIIRFRRAYPWIFKMLLDGKIIFEEFLCNALLTKYLS